MLTTLIWRYRFYLTTPNPRSGYIFFEWFFMALPTFVYLIKLWERLFSVTVNFTKTCIFSLCCGYIDFNFEIKYFWPGMEPGKWYKPQTQKRGFAHVGFLRTYDIFFRIVQTMESDKKIFSCNFFKVTH